ncbi:MAG: hypothetical protein R2780_08450 [Crocinitomicaceae bacterium]
MNKVVNVFSLIILTVFTLLGMTIIFDLSISNFHLKAMPFKMEVMSALALLVFLLGILRIRRRWQGIKDMSQFKQFELDMNVSKAFIKREKLFTFMEIMFMSAAIIIYIRLSLLDFDLMIVMIAVLSVLVAESMVFLSRIEEGKTFRIGMNAKVIAYFGREMHLFFYTGLQRVEMYQSDTISFKYKDGLVLFLPIVVINEKDRLLFRETLVSILDEKNIYYDDALRNWK